MAIAIAIIIAMVATAKYISVGGRLITVFAVGLTCGAESTLNAVTACEGQYDSEPLNEA